MRKALLLFITFLLISVSSFSQQTVTGKVTDANGLPLAGISVVAKKTGKVTMTTSDGTFRIAAAADDELEFTAIGYANQTVAVKGDVINVMLVQSVEELGQVVLIGTRRLGRVRTETTAPVDVINVGQTTAPTARMDLTSVLNYAAPSFNYNKQRPSLPPK